MLSLGYTVQQDFAHCVAERGEIVMDYLTKFRSWCGLWVWKVWYKHFELSNTFIGLPEHYKYGLLVSSEDNATLWETGKDAIN